MVRIAVDTNEVRAVAPSIGKAVKKAALIVASPIAPAQLQSGPG
jgi:hypothetical protein